MDVHWEQHAGEYETLAVALRAVLAGDGDPPPYEELVSVLGLGGTVVAVRDDCLGWWPTYGRDVALLSAARLYGVLLRELHPPAAAEGLDAAEQYAVHYHDSYEPLIRRALEVGQVALAWRGWPEPHDREWGVITGSSSEGCTGWAVGTTAEPTMMTGPAWQVYIVERVERPGMLSDENRFEAALDALRQFWRGPCAKADRALVTGGGGYRILCERLESGQPCRHCDERSGRCLAQLATRVAGSANASATWLEGLAPSLGDEAAKTAERWIALCRETAGVMEPLAAEESAARLLSHDATRTQWRETLAAVASQWGQLAS